MLWWFWEWWFDLFWLLICSNLYFRKTYFKLHSNLIKVCKCKFLKYYTYLYQSYTKYSNIIIKSIMISNPKTCHVIMLSVNSILQMFNVKHGITSCIVKNQQVNQTSQGTISSIMFHWKQCCNTFMLYLMLKPNFKYIYNIYNLCTYLIELHTCAI